MEMQITNPFLQIDNRLRKNKNSQSKIEIKLNGSEISIKITSSETKKTCRQKLRPPSKNPWNKLKE